MTLDERIGLYLAKCPPAVSGQDGHGVTFRVACALVNGFALDPEAAFRHLSEYNATCCPPWKPRELRHKIGQAGKVAHDKARGHLLGSDEKHRREAIQAAPKLVPVRLKPRNWRSRTVRTVFSEPYVNAREGEEGRNDIYGAPKQPSVPSGAPPATLDWTAINAEHPPTEDENNWQAVVGAGFGDEPLILAAFTLFGPGCRVVTETREEAP